MNDHAEELRLVEELFREHQRYLHGVAFKFVRDDEAARDIVQEVFLKVWRRRRQIDFQKGIRSYLFRSVSNASINFLQKRKSKISALAELSVSHDTTAPEDPNTIYFKELQTRVQVAIEKLPPKCKVIFLLSRNEGLKCREIADQLDLSAKTVENQLGIALQKLRSDLKPFLSREFISSVILAILVYLLTKLLS